VKKQKVQKKLKFKKVGQGQQDQGQGQQDQGQGQQDQGQGQQEQVQYAF
jgi:hypothetical protein